MSIKVPRLTQIAARIEARVFAMPPEDQQQAKAAIDAIVAGAQGLKVFPPELASDLWDLLQEVIIKTYRPFPPKPETVTLQIVEGAPRLLTAERLQKLLS
jgi:hypothetical protein